MNPAKLEKYMGRWITPILVTAIVGLCIVGFVKLDTPLQSPIGDYQTGAFFKGFLEGYNTMDALASLAFGIVILTSIKQKGISDDKHLTKYTLKAALVAGVLLSIVYVSIGWMGVKMAGNGTFENGTQLLASTSTLLLGKSGTALLGFIFTLACFNTVVGLTTACGQYFSNLIPKISYKTVVLIVTLVGFTLANLGLSQILKVSVPFLVTAYPLTIVLIILTFFNRFFTNTRVVYGSAMLFTGVFAVLGGLSATGMNLGVLQTVKEVLPFSSVGLEWIVPALVGTGIGMLLSNFSKSGPDPAVE
jgi:LIVCS family branched-chain amino acid:cation transporter